MQEQPPPPQGGGGGGGGSRAAQRRQKKRARQQADGSSAAPTPAPTPATVPEAAAAALSSVPSAPAAPSVAEAAPSAAPAYDEWSMEMPPAGSELFDAVQLALSQANTIVGRKYRYGAILLAGDDHIPMKSGSNKKPFQRDNIHAEMSVLKGCARPAGKDMLIARLAPSRAASNSKGRPNNDDDDDDDDDDVRELAGHCAPVQSSGAAGQMGKVLNARPCARCEMKMVQRGVRRCYFTLNGNSLGVLEYNPETASTVS